MRDILGLYPGFNVPGTTLVNLAPNHPSVGAYLPLSLNRMMPPVQCAHLPLPLRTAQTRLSPWIPMPLQTWQRPVPVQK